MATFVRFLRLATDMSSARRQAADDMDRGFSYLGYGDENDGRGEAFAGLCGYRVADADDKPSNVEYEDCEYYAVFSGEFLGRDTASDGDLFRAEELIEVHHTNIIGDNEYSDEEMALINEW